MAGDGAFDQARSPGHWTLAAQFETGAMRFGHRMAVLGDVQALTHADLQARIVTLRNALYEAGFGPSARVAVELPKSADSAVLLLAVASACCCVPLNPAMTRQERGRVLLACQVDACITVRESAAWHQLETLSIARIAVTDAGDALQEVPPIAPANGGGLPQADDAALLLQTSGSTAEPKRVLLTHRQLRLSAAAMATSLALDADDRCLNMMPLFHVGAIVDLLLAPLSVGGAVRVTELIAAHAFFDALQQFRPTWYQAVPTMLREIMAVAALERRSAEEAGSLRLVRAVSSTLPASLQADVEATLACPVISIYGMTETAGVITSQPLPPESGPQGSVGQSCGPEIAIRDAQAMPLPTGQPGEVWVRGPTVITRYEGLDPAGTHDADGWLRTGDLGLLDAEGFLFLRGRVKEVINRGGEKISPMEIDQCLIGHPDVLEAAAFAVPHPSLGEEVAVAVVPRPNVAFDPGDIDRFLRRRLSGFKCPRRIERVEALPLGRTGKIQRRALSEQFKGHFSEPNEARMPETPSARVVAQLWTRALNVGRVGLTDNFFDLGGDSLTAATMLGELQELAGVELAPGALFDYPTLGAFVRYVEAQPRSAVLASFLREHLPDSGLPPVVYRDLQAVMRGWSGRRSHPHSLVTGHQLDGDKTPLFWVVQDHEELTETVRHLGPERPVYGMRSLFRLPSKRRDHLQHLAGHLASEIAQLRPRGKILLGGFCSGGRLAIDIARELQDRGRHVALLCLLDPEVDVSYQGDVALFHARQPGGHINGRFPNPARGWDRCLRGRQYRQALDVGHPRVLRPETSACFGQALLRVLERFEAGDLPWSEPPPEPGAVSSAAYRASIRCRQLPVLPPNGRVRIPVRVRNTSAERWPATCDSGLRLVANLRRPPKQTGGPYRGVRRISGTAELPQAVEPGEEVELTVELRARGRPRRYILEMDLVDDGIAWFSEQGSECLREPVWVLPGAAMLSALKGAGR